ncbi:Uncharacterized protein Rs2_20503 [Raphanus sativus]|nr:Uncharacterized protein Rs2_20503 [Raphanus sativus]
MKKTEANMPTLKQNRTRELSVFQPRIGRKHNQRYQREGRDPNFQRPPRYQSKVWQERSSYRQVSQAKERARYDQGQASRPTRDNSISHHVSESKSRSYYREVGRIPPEIREEASSASKNLQDSADRGIPLQNVQVPIPEDVLNEARVELREYMV